MAQPALSAGHRHPPQGTLPMVDDAAGRCEYWLFVPSGVVAYPCNEADVNALLDWAGGVEFQSS